MIRIGINGVGGRMGQRVVALAAANEIFEIVAAVETATHSRIGFDAGETAGITPIGVPITTDWEQKVDVMIDFSSPECTETLIRNCLERDTALVFATTGITPEQYNRLNLAAKNIPVLYSPSMSRTVNLAMKLCKLTARTLKNKDTDVEILEKHHRFKVDAPSGTAIKFGTIISEEMGNTHFQHGRSGTIGKRSRNEIGFHSVRIGDNPGEHTIMFGLLGETLEITVKASNRDCYAQGALDAAQFLFGKKPGFYSMDNVMGLQD
ncbi:MAG: 4-hydroxy-tetrahydrodipicolinate reductase [Planctomycetaceae bacterium]|jgi:4-hydroxy-tetrahydrodipicolinate reductase|nr:4-hydroxy-tetrahydrodipicolinate reductase [Planctomycetaceae bacterium]